MSSGCVIEVDGPTITLEDSKTDKKTHKFTFDHAYFWDCTQDQVYTDLGKPILDGALGGFNSTIFAYGQTGSGKTFSMMGGEDAESEGIIPKLNKDLFIALEEAKAKATAEGTSEPDASGKTEPKVKMEFLVSVSYLEIYNEVIKDLLNPSDKRLEVREHPRLGIYVQDLATLIVKDAESVKALIEQGNGVRQVAATQMNERSSRSHSCFIVKIETRRVEKVTTDSGKEAEQTSTVTARLNLVDLAGSERQAKTGATGARLKEGAAINKSLTALGNVINALAEAEKSSKGHKGGKAHIPYRDSKLTRLLQDSLGGNARTLMIAAISPAADNFEETLSTLRYADRAKQIKNVSRRNEDVNQQVISQLRSEIDELRKQLLAQQTASVAATTGEDRAKADQERQELEETIAALEHAKQQSWDQQQELSRLYEEERKKNLSNEKQVMSVMKTVKEENLETLRALKALDNEAATSTKRFRKLRTQHKGTREQLAEQMKTWQRLHEMDGGAEDGPHGAEIAASLASVARLHAAVEEEQAELLGIKKRLQEIDEEREEVRAEASAQRKFIEEDAEIRRSIAEDERKRLAVEAKVQLQAMMEEQQAALEERTRVEIAELKARIEAEAKEDGGASAAEAAALKIELVEAKKATEMEQLRVQDLQAKLTVAHETGKAEAEEALQAAKIRELRMMRELVEGYDEERRRLKAHITSLAGNLRSATQDIEFLSQEVQSLRGQLILARVGGEP
jgi:kinesin family protein 1/kinesin family protein 3/17